MYTVKEIAEARRVTSNPERCRAVREFADVGLREAAMELRRDPATLSRWERGIRRPRANDAVRWARLLRAHFHLDGQTAMIDDYLERRPERADELPTSTARRVRSSSQSISSSAKLRIDSLHLRLYCRL